MSKFLNETDSINRLLEIFKNACLEQYDTYVTNDAEYYNRLYSILVTVNNELKMIVTEARRSLIRLLSDDNPQVRLQAAKFVYPVAQDEARKCLVDLKAGRMPDQALDAGMTLRSLEKQPGSLDQ